MKKQLTSTETKAILRHIILNNQQLAEEGKKAVALSILGNAGIGKTAIVHQIAEELSMGFVRINLAEVTPDDFLGYPIKEFEYQKEDDNRWIPESLVQLYLSRGYEPTHRSQMSYAIPQWLTGKQDKPIVMFLDDCSRGNLALLQATMTIIDEGKYISWALPKGSSVILSNNPDTGDYLVTSTDSAQKTRYLEVEMKFDVDAWGEWAEAYKMNGRCINFILKNAEVVEGIQNIEQKEGEAKTLKANIRLWTKFFDAIGGIKDWSGNLDLVMNLGNALPEEHMLLFTQFIHNKLDKLPQPKQLLDNDKQWVVNELTSLIGKEKTNRRQDLAAILMKRLINYIISNEDQMKKDDVERMADIIETDLFTKDLVQLALRKLVKTKKFKNILTLPTHPSILNLYK